MRQTKTRFLTLTTCAVVAIATAATGCQDLNVPNENSPDRTRALGSGPAIENVIASSFLAWYNTLHGLADVAVPFPQVSDEMTNTTTQESVQWSREPRQVFRNDQLAPEIWIPRRFYDNFSECMASTNDGLTQIKNGVKILTVDLGTTTEVDNTDRAYTWAKLWQGVCMGYLALTLDRFAVATEDSILPTGWDALSSWEKAQMSEGSNWDERLAVALKSLDQAIQRAETGAQWRTPTNWINGQQLTNAQVVQLAHTLAARLLVYSARYPKDRQALDWNLVLSHTQKGLTFDFGPTLATGVITDPSYLDRLLRTSSGQLRADYRMIGRADQSGEYQKWLAKPAQDAVRFNIVTPDRRITGTTPTSNGAYFRYSTSLTGFDASLGEGYWSNYQWYRRANTAYGGFSSSTGFFALASVDENRLFQAEALIRLGRASEAVPLINVTRTRGVSVGTTRFDPNLPAVTTAGVPTVGGACVPRREDGTCGDLMDALKWERLIELTGQDPVRAWLDRRGFGELQPGTWVQLPVPARYLVGLGLPNYTFGGVGGKCSAETSCE
jgi:hypothetical protein